MTKELTRINVNQVEYNYSGHTPASMNGQNGYNSRIAQLQYIHAFHDHSSMILVCLYE